MKQIKKALIGLAALAVLGFGTSALAFSFSAPQQDGLAFELFDIYGNPIVVVEGSCSGGGGGGC